MKIKIDEFELSLDVKNLEQSLAFYIAFGFEKLHGDDSTYAIMGNGQMKIGLYQGLIKSNLLTFWGENTYEKAIELKQMGLTFETEPNLEQDGTVGATLVDPDGNRIYLLSYEEVEPNE